MVKDKNGDGVLVRLKSRTITLAIQDDSDVATLLEKAIDKHARHHQQFNKEGKYILLYHDMSIVNYLPRSNTPFVLSEYQKDLLVPYSKMYFWLCTEADFQNSLYDESTDTDNDVIHVKAIQQPDKRKDNAPTAEASSTSLATTSYDNTRRDVSQGRKLPQRETQTLSSSQTLSSTQGIEKFLIQHQCPTCLGYFSRADIEVHADICAENWIDPIGECADIVTINDHDEKQSCEETRLTTDEIDALVPEMVESRKEVIQIIKDNVNRTSINRISIRRREAFQDYVETRRKKWFTEGAILKINFAGEPAVDGGGPRREFFTGENFSTCTVFLGFKQNIWRVLLHPFYQMNAHTRVKTLLLISKIMWH